MPTPSFRDIKFKFENFAGISTCEFSLSSLTVMSGPNAAGKTYIVYAIYSFLKELTDLVTVPVAIDALRRLTIDGVWTVDVDKLVADNTFSENASAAFREELPRYFSVPENFFEGANVAVDLPLRNFMDFSFERQIQVRKDLILEITKPEGSAICTFTISGEARTHLPQVGLRRFLQLAMTDLVFGHLQVRPFAITSERTGISLFWKELDINKNQIIEKLIDSKGKKFNAWDLIQDQTSRYALPITDNIDLARDADNVVKQKSFISDDKEIFDYINGCFDKISGGKYKYSKDGISFEYGRGKSKSTIPIYVASSSTKSLFLLDIFISHVAEIGDLLVFDEPELNLHPANQRLMAQLIARLVSVGVNVLMTTHSDFLIREINNRIMLSIDMPGREEVFKKSGIDSREVIYPGSVHGFLLAKDRKLEAVSVGMYGIDMKSIDDAIVGASSLQGQILGLIANSGA